MFKIIAWFLGLLDPLASAFQISEVESLWALPLVPMVADADGDFSIRVRVYPHEFKNSETKRAAEPLDKITLIGSCQIGYGQPRKAAPLGPLVSQFKSGSVKTLKLGIHQIKKPLWLKCDGPVTVQRNEPLISHPYLADFYIRKSAPKEFDGKEVIEVIAVMKIETYLRGVVPSEIIPSWPEEALKTQAIAARSYAYFNIAHNHHFPNPKIYDVDDTNRFQSFSGLTSVHPLTDQAIAKTKGLIVTYKNMSIPAFFDTDAGGQTESAKEVFNFEAPYCAIKAEPPEVTSALKSWKAEIRVADLMKKLGDPAKSVNPAMKLSSVEIESKHKTPGQRVRELTLKFEGQPNRSIKFDALRAMEPKIKSSLFKVSLEGETLTFTGTGAGHGVGLSQVGMKYLAANHWSYEKILNFYFNDIKICLIGTASKDQASCPKPESLQAH